MLRDHGEPRVFLGQPVSLMLPKQKEKHRGWGLNVSLGGMYVRHDPPLLTGQAVRVRFNTPSAARLEAEGEVVRVDGVTDANAPRGMAIRFRRPEKKFTAALQQFIAKRLEPDHGKPVRFCLERSNIAMKTTLRDCWDDLVMVEAPLNFLRQGDPVALETNETDSRAKGRIEWVSIRATSDDDVPRLSIAVKLDQDAPQHKEADPVQSAVDHAVDPVHTKAFSDHAERVSAQTRKKVRKPSKSVRPKRAPAASRSKVRGRS